MAKLIEIPASISVNVPKLGASVSVAIPDDITDEVIHHILHHGLKQKIVDATAGVNSSDYNTKEEYMGAVRKAVDARLATILTIPSERAFGPRNPVETEARRLVAAFLVKIKAVAKASEAAERTSTFAKAQVEFAKVVSNMATKANPTATPDELMAVVERNWVKLIKVPAEAEVARKAAAVEGMSVDLNE